MAPSARRLGVIGAGNIGGAVAANLLADGHAVAVHDTDPARSAALVRAGFRRGPLGGGNTAKLGNSLLAFTATWSSLEGLAVAAKAGINLRTMIEVIRTGGAGNFFTERMVEGINERGRPTQFALALAAKDAGLLLEVAREAGVPVPVAAEVAQALVAAVDAGLGGRDFTDLVELIERRTGVALRLPPA